MDTSSVRRGEWIAGISGVALFFFMFFSWYGIDAGSLNIPAGVPQDIAQQAIDNAEAAGLDTTATAWQAFDFIDIILLIAVVVSVGYAVIGLTGSSPDLPVAGSAVTALVGAIAFVLVLYRLIDPPGGDGVGREIGVWLGLIATAGIAVGGYMGMQEEGTSFSDQADRVTQ